MKIDGVAQVAEMLERMDEADRSRIMAELEARDPLLAEQIRDRVHVQGFERLALWEAKDLHELLSAVPRAVLRVALKGTAPDFLGGILRGLSRDAGKALVEELEAEPPRGKGEIAAARRDILALAKRLAAQGKVGRR